MKKPLVIFLFVALLLSGCKKEAPDTLPEALLNNPGMELLEEVEILYSDSAEVKVRITGPVMYYFTQANEPRQEFPGGIMVQFLDRDQQVASTLTAKYAIRRESLGTIIVRDSVVWQSTRDELLTTDELTWDERRQKIFTDRFVVINRPGEMLYGRGFEADQDFTNITMKAVEGRVVLEEDQNNKKQSGNN